MKYKIGWISPLLPAPEASEGINGRGALSKVVGRKHLGRETWNRLAMANSSSPACA